MRILFLVSNHMKILILYGIERDHHNIGLMGAIPLKFRNLCKDLNEKISEASHFQAILSKLCVKEMELIKYKIVCHSCI